MMEKSRRIFIEIRRTPLLKWMSFCMEIWEPIDCNNAPTLTNCEGCAEEWKKCR